MLQIEIHGKDFRSGMRYDIEQPVKDGFDSFVTALSQEIGEYIRRGSQRESDIKIRVANGGDYIVIRLSDLFEVFYTDNPPQVVRLEVVMYNSVLSGTVRLELKKFGGKPKRITMDYPIEIFETLTEEAIVEALTKN